MDGLEQPKDQLKSFSGRNTRNSAKSASEDSSVNPMQGLLTSTPKSNKKPKGNNTPNKSKILISSPKTDAKKGKNKQRGPTKTDSDKDIRECFNSTISSTPECMNSSAKNNNTELGVTRESTGAESDQTLTDIISAVQTTTNLLSPTLSHFQSNSVQSFHSTSSKLLVSPELPNPIDQSTGPEAFTPGIKMSTSANNGDQIDQTKNVTNGRVPISIQNKENGLNNSEKLANAQILDTREIVNMEELAKGEEISNATVVNMFQQLMSTMNTMNNVKEELRREIQTGKSDNSRQVEEVKVIQNRQNNDIAQLKKENNHYKNKLDRFADMIAYQGHLLEELGGKANSNDLEKCKPNLIIQGIPEKKEENCATEVKEFFKNQLLLVQDVQIKFAHRIGTNTKRSRAMKVSLVHQSDKGLIYSHAKNLKEKVSSSGKPYRIDDELPPKLREEKNKSIHLMWRNKTTTAEKIEMSVKKGKLIVQGQNYESKIVPPDTHVLSKLKPEEIEELEKLDIRHGVSETVEGSTFTGYVADVQSFREVNRAYE